MTTFDTGHKPIPRPANDEPKPTIVMAEELVAIRAELAALRTELREAIAMATALATEAQTALAGLQGGTLGKLLGIGR